MNNKWLNSYQTIEGNTIKYHLENISIVNNLSDNLNEATDDVLNDIDIHFKQPKFLALSGGVDSEYVADRLIEKDIDFIPILLQIEQTNVVELWWAKQWCALHNKRPIIVETSIDKLINYITEKGMPQYLTINLGAYITLFLADYVDQNFKGILLVGSGDLRLKNNEYYFWDGDLILDCVRRGKHPLPIFCYNQQILFAWVSNYLGQGLKSHLYNVTSRPKIDYFTHPKWHKYISEVNQYVKFENFKLGNKKQTLDWIINNDHHYNN